MEPYFSIKQLSISLRLVYGDRNAAIRESNALLPAINNCGFLTEQTTVTKVQ